MKDNIKKPTIRFDGFADNWEQRKLSSIASMHARIGWQNLRKAEFLESGDYYLITGTDFVDGEIDLSNCHYVDKERYEQDRNIQIHNGSILITKDGTLGKVAYVKDLDKPATLNAGVFNVVTTDKNVDSKYLFQYLKAPFLMDYVDQKATGGTIKHLNQNILVDFPVAFPSFEEQTLIGETFLTLDNLIILHRRKHAKLVNIKKAMHEKLFPRDGANVPEVRFKGFTGDWERHKVSDLLVERNEQSPKSSEYPLMAFVAYEGVAPKGMRYDRSSLVNDTENKLYKRTEKGDFIYSSNNLETGSIGLNNYGCACISPVYSIFSATDMSNTEFIGQRFVQKDFINEMVKWRQGVIYGQWRIHEDDFLKIEVLVPSLSEQEKIGKFLRSLEDHIVLQKQKLQKLQLIKKAMIEKMFV